MTAAACSRIFEAEAVRDGRLVGPHAASFARHVSVCRQCAREVQALDALAESLKSCPAGIADELHARRERTRLLAAFDRELLRPNLRWGRVRGRLWPLAAVVAVAGAVVFWRLGPGARTSPSSIAVVRADGAALWSRRSEGQRETVTVVRGSLWIHVDHRSLKGSLHVLVPDGEIEDTGTTFTVTVKDGATSRVWVQEGSVALRIHGRRSVTSAQEERGLRARRSPSRCDHQPACHRVPAELRRLIRVLRARLGPLSFRARRPGLCVRTRAGPTLRTIFARLPKR